jgi:hypothetical protein
VDAGELSVQLVDVALLIEVLLAHNDDVDERVVLTEVAAALNSAGYPFTTRQVTARDAAAMLEDLDRGVVRSTAEQRAALGASLPPAE